MRIENDRKIFAAHYPAIVPFLMEEYRGVTEFEIYSGIQKTVASFEKAFAGHYFSEKALRFIASSLDDYIERHGYARDKKGETLWYNSFEGREKSAIDRTLILPATHLLSDELLKSLPLKNRTTFSLQELLAKKLAAFVTLWEGEVAAIATVNETAEETKVMEITVETAVPYRGRGFATSCVAALAAYLLDSGAYVAYCCRNTNYKSNKIAKKVGLEKVGRFYAVSAYRVKP